MLTAIQAIALAGHAVAQGKLTGTSSAQRQVSIPTITFRSQAAIALVTYSQPRAGAVIV